MTAFGLVVVLVGTAAAPAQATLELVKRSDGDAATFVGNGGYSADGLGQFTPGGKVQADVPTGSTVQQAYLYGTYYGVQRPIPAAQRTVDFDGTAVQLEDLPHAATGCCALGTARADVTQQVAAKVGTGGSVSDFVIGSDPANLDGVALVVIYSNPGSPFRTIALLDGGAEQAGDLTTFQFATPINTSVPQFDARMSLGSGFSYQGVFSDPHTCGGMQYSIVDVNDKRLTSCAGHYDDGLGGNGALVTVGGVGDDPANPADPDATSGGTDDELYDLEPFLSDGTREVQIRTANPSGDDNLFLAVIAITGIGSVGCAEDGLRALDGTPAAGAVTKTVHERVEPAAQTVGAGELVHQVNCTALAPVESLLNAPPPSQPPGTPGLG